LTLAHDGILFMSFFLFAHLATTIGAWLLDRRAEHSGPDGCLGKLAGDKVWNFAAAAHA
jgi:hypothetical protein